MLKTRKEKQESQKNKPDQQPDCKGRDHDAWDGQEQNGPQVGPQEPEIDVVARLEEQARQEYKEDQLWLKLGSDLDSQRGSQQAGAKANKDHGNGVGDAQLGRGVGHQHGDSQKNEESGEYGLRMQRALLSPLLLVDSIPAR